MVGGVQYTPQWGAVSLLADGDMLTGAGDLADRRLMVVGTAYSSEGGPPTGAYLVDITGPWR